MAKLGVAVAILAIALGPLYTDPSYDWTRNTVSELAAQNTRHAWIMQVGLFALGVGLVLDFFRQRSRADLPFAAFGVFQRAIFGTFFVWVFVDFRWRGGVDRALE